MPTGKSNRIRIYGDIYLIEQNTELIIKQQLIAKSSGSDICANDRLSVYPLFMSSQFTKIVIIPNCIYKDNRKSEDIIDDQISLEGFSCSAVHWDNFCCIFIQLSADVPVAMLIRIAISGLNDDFSLMNSDRVFRLTPSNSAVLVTDRCNGFMTSS